MIPWRFVRLGLDVFCVLFCFIVDTYPGTEESGIQKYGFTWPFMIVFSLRHLVIDWTRHISKLPCHCLRSVLLRLDDLEGPIS